jgi:hypothetical protein
VQDSKSPYFKKFLETFFVLDGCPLYLSTLNVKQ